MAEATDRQIQQFADERVRPWSEHARALYLSAKDHKALIDDTYAKLDKDKGFVDSRTDAPPHLLTSDDILAWNAFVTAFIEFWEGNPNAPKIMQACVRPAVIQ